MLNEIYFSDGYLTNYDIENLNISPQLMILSACNAGLWERRKGEGVISLSRGFFETGVKSLISTIWSIEDESYSLIMKNIYSYLKAGKSKPEALTLAKIEYLNTSDKYRLHPYFWEASFKLAKRVLYTMRAIFHSFGQ